jgi:ubiquitin carboxyl-terminal hydrolase L3
MQSESDSFIANLLHASMTLTPNERAQMLEENEELEQVYSEVAQKGDTEAPSNVEDEVDFHYIAFVKSQKNGHLYQLDGDRKQPIDLGLLTADQDMLSETCLDVIRNMMAEEADNPNFSLMALVEG